MPIQTWLSHGMANPDRGDERESEISNASVDLVTDSMKSLMAPGLRAAGDVTGLQFVDETQMKQWGPQLILNRMLPGKTYISTDSSQAGSDHRAQGLKLFEPPFC